MDRRAETGKGKLAGVTEHQGSSPCREYGIVDPTPGGGDQSSCWGYFHGGLKRKELYPQWAPGSSPFCLGALSTTLGGERKVFQKLNEPRVPVAFWNYFWWGRGKTATPPSGPEVSASHHHRPAMDLPQSLYRSPSLRGRELRPPGRRGRKNGGGIQGHEGLRGIGEREEKGLNRGSSSTTYMLNGKGTFLFSIQVHILMHTHT